MKLEAIGVRHCRRIVSDDGELLAMAEQYANDLWAVHSLSGGKLCEPEHKTPTRALRWFKAYEARNLDA